jgi:hypothetical protein
MHPARLYTIAAGNAFLPAFMEQYHARFAKAPIVCPFILSASS